MAKKKITKKPVSKRTTPDTLDERNERLGKTDAPKTRKPRAQKPKPVITTEPAINTVWREGTAEEFLGDTQTTPPPPVEYTKVNKNVVYSAWEWINFKLDDAKAYWKKHDPITAITDFAFAHPLFFAIVFSTAVLIVVLAFGIAARIFGW
jgi:hypothetical protein